jgi:predicted Ser/Thr protein kinase
VDTAVTDPVVGLVLEGRYRLEERLARGGMSTVYAATDLRLHRTVAVKVMAEHLAHDPTFVDRFTREARAAAMLSHPNVVSVSDQGSDQGLVFLVMELVRGRTLRDLLQARGRLTVAEDVDRGRVYLPADVMAAHGVTREQLQEKRHDARFGALMQEMVAIVRRRYDDAAPGTPMLAPESRDCVRAATALYGGILTEIERADHRVLDRRVTVSKPRRLGIFARRLASAQAVRLRTRRSQA